MSTQLYFDYLIAKVLNKNMALGQNIKKLRKARKWSQDQLSKMTGGIASQGAISNLEKRDSSSSEFTEVLAKALEVSIYELLGSIDPATFVDATENVQRNDIADRSPATIAKLLENLTIYLSLLDDETKVMVAPLLSNLAINPNSHKTTSEMIEAALISVKKNNTQSKLPESAKSDGQ